MNSTSEGEQNRLIVENMNLATRVAAGYRGAKGIPFEDLEASGREGLVKAARAWPGRGDFGDWAAVAIHNKIKDFIRSWEEFLPLPAEEVERNYYEWDIFPMAAPFESWTSLAATPEQLLEMYQEVSANISAMQSAMIALDKRERAMIVARFMRCPIQTLESVAREHKISYAMTVKIVNRALRKLREMLAASELKAA